LENTPNPIDIPYRGGRIISTGAGLSGGRRGVNVKKEKRENGETGMKQKR
jgi:hypothetical protein